MQRAKVSKAEALRYLTKTLKIYPDMTGKFFNGLFDKPCTERVYRRLFGTWEKAKVLAGKPLKLDIRPGFDHIPDDNLLPSKSKVQLPTSNFQLPTSVDHPALSPGSPLRRNPVRHRHYCHPHLLLVLRCIGGHHRLLLAAAS